MVFFYLKIVCLLQKIFYLSFFRDKSLNKCARCLYGWKYVIDRCYYYIQELSGYDDSTYMCESRGGKNLIIFNDTNHFNAIANSIPFFRTADYWV